MFYWFHIYSKVIQCYIYIYFRFFFIMLLQDIEYSSLCYLEGPCLPILYIVVCIC